MPLVPDLLRPIPGSSACGQSLRYDSIYDQIKEARREEESLPQGEWRRELKRADSELVIRLGTDALAARSKDLWIATWLTEALLRRDGMAGLRQGLDLLRGLLETFWEGLYPELEEGDAELRAAPLAWLGSRLEERARRVPLSRSGFDWLRYKESRDLGRSQGDVREAAVKDGKLSPEEFDKDVALTDTAFYEALAHECREALDSLHSLDVVCTERFGEAAPSFSKLREGLEDVDRAVQGFLRLKQEREPAVSPRPQETNAEESALPARAPNLIPEEPSSREEAIGRVLAVARYLRRLESSSPVAYLLLRAVRGGELRASGSNPDSALLEAPPTESRQNLKQLAMQGQWRDLLDRAQEATGTPCGRAWLDLERYIVQACRGLGSQYDPIALAVTSELKSFLSDYPQLPGLTFTDDTPTANPETQTWLRQILSQARTVPLEEPAPVETQDGAPADVNRRSPDVYELAREAAGAGRVEEAIERLTLEIAQERSGRARFQRKIQLAELCMAFGQEMVAYPILRELADEIEERKLDEWEATDVVAHPLTLLFRYLHRLDRNSDEKQRIYERICRLDPRRAVACLK